MAHDVFVSYSSKDKAVADTVVASLEKNNIRCWYAPRDIKPGDDWGQAITNAIETGKVFLIIFSGNANQSRHVLDELLFAINEQRTILPFRIENLEPIGAMKLHLSSRHWLDAYDPTWEVHLKKLVSDVSTILETKIGEEQIQLPEGIKKATRQQKKSKLGLLFAVLAAVIVLGVAGWIAWPRLFPSEPEQQEVETATSTHEEVNTATTEITQTMAVDEDAIIEKVDRNAVLDLAYSAKDELNIAPQDYNNFEETTLSENLFLNLTNIDHDTLSIVPEAATSWSISPDGKLYTFEIRNDIPWVTHTLKGETKQVLDENGEPRFLSAYDFEYAIRRICDPNTDFFDYQTIPLIKGCKEVYEYDEPANIPGELFEAIGAKAITENELMIELIESSGYFLTITTTNAFTPSPSWAIEKYGAAWINPGLIQTNGYYVIDELVLGERLSLIRNPLLPEDLTGNGNIGTINIYLGHTKESAYNLWENSEIDFTEIPDGSLSDHKQSYPNRIYLQYPLGSNYINLNSNKQPFNDVLARRAFAAALDKAALIDNMWGEGNLPTNNLVVPGLIAAPGNDLNSLGYDPDYAKDELAEAGYPNCEGLSQINFHNFFSAIMPDDVLRKWEDALGCPKNTIVMNEEFLGDEETDMYMIGWAVDYPDQNNMYEFILCNNSFPKFTRECNYVDEMISNSKQEINLVERTELIRQLEETLFGENGEFPVIPVSIKTFNYAVQDWLEITPFHFGKIPYYDWVVDMDLKK